MNRYANAGLNRDAEWLAAYDEVMSLADNLDISDEYAIKDATLFTEEFDYQNAVNRMIVEGSFNENKT